LQAESIAIQLSVFLGDNVVSNISTVYIHTYIIKVIVPSHT